MSKSRKSQIKYYTNLLKEDEILLLSSCDEFFKNHYIGSPLNILTNFSGTEGEAILEKSGKITIFVDTRYHILVDKQVFSDIEIYKLDLKESFIDAFKKKYKQNTVLYVPDNIQFIKYLKYDDYFDLRRYNLKDDFLSNADFDKNAKIFLINDKVEKNNFEFKLNKFKKAHSKIGKCLVFNLDNISYLTNLRSFQMKYSSNFKSILYLDFESNNNILFVDNIKKLEDIKIEKLKYKNLSEFNNFISSINSDIYINYDDISLSKFLSIKHPKQFKNSNLSLIASVKPKSVIDDMILSSKKLDNAIFNFKNLLKEGLSEVDLVNLFENELFKAGAKSTSFKTLLAINENSASIHYSTYDKNKILKNESILLLDCGGYYESGFATDITRTFYFGKNPNQIYKKIYTNVLKTFITCFQSNETDAKKLDANARQMLEPYANIGFNFNHGLGHGIGTSVHQNPPCLSILSNDTIKAYQTHSIEPGLYGRDLNSNIEFGVRIENCVYMDLNYKRHSLSKFPFEEVLIDYSILSINEREFISNWQNNFLKE